VPMALTDPAKFKEVAGTEVTAPRISTGDKVSVYETSDGLNKLTISTQEINGRLRHLCRVDTSKLTTNIYEESKKQSVTTSVYLVIDRPENGFTVAECVKQIEGLFGFLSATSYANATKILGRES
jgi:peroxiredoxin family protein